MIAQLVNFFGDARYKKHRWRVLVVILGLVTLADFLVARTHTDYVWQAIPGWSALFGFVSCVAIIFISKVIGHNGGIMRDEDYYD